MNTIILTYAIPMQMKVIRVLMKIIILYRSFNPDELFIKLDFLNMPV